MLRWGKFDFAPLIDATFASRPELGGLLKSVLCPVEQCDVPSIDSILQHPLLAHAVAAVQAQQQELYHKEVFAWKCLQAYTAGSALLSQLKDLHSKLEWASISSSSSSLTFQEQVAMLEQQYSSNPNYWRLQHLDSHVVPSDDRRVSSMSWEEATAAAGIYPNSMGGPSALCGG